jgi:hypothetical protein
MNNTTIIKDYLQSILIHPDNITTCHSTTQDGYRTIYHSYLKITINKREYHLHTSDTIIYTIYEIIPPIPPKRRWWQYLLWWTYKKPLSTGRLCDERIKIDLTNPDSLNILTKTIGLHGRYSF